MDITSVTYVARTRESKIVLSFDVDASTPTVDELDTATTAFFDSIEAQRPGLVSYVRKEHTGRESVKGNFWGGPAAGKDT